MIPYRLRIPAAQAASLRALVTTLWQVAHRGPGALSARVVLPQSLHAFFVTALRTDKGEAGRRPGSSLEEGSVVFPYVHLLVSIHAGTILE